MTATMTKVAGFCVKVNGQVVATGSRAEMRTRAKELGGKVEKNPETMEAKTEVGQMIENEYDRYLQSWGYTETEIETEAKKAEVEAKRAAEQREKNEQIARNSEERNREYSEQKRSEKAAKLAEFVEGKKAEAPAKPAPSPVQNAAGIEVTRTDGGRYLIFGNPVTAIFRFMGNNAWTHEQAMKAVKAAGIPDGEVSESTARIQMNAGKKGGDCGGRGPVPTLTPEQVAKLNAAAGR